MGTDTPISAMSSKSKLLYTYFQQNFAQVTNPPIDPIREELVMSLVSFIGPRPNLLDPPWQLEEEAPREVRQPILTNEDLEKIRSIGTFEDSFDTKTLGHHPTRRRAARRAWRRRSIAFARAPTRRYLAATTSSSCRIALVGARPHPDPRVARDRRRVHHHLIRAGLRTSVGLVVGDRRGRGEVHHFALLAGLRRRGDQPLSRLLRDPGRDGQDLPRGGQRGQGDRAIHQGRSARALLKVMSKMGISTLPVVLRRADLRRGRASPTAS